MSDKSVDWHLEKKITIGILFSIFSLFSSGTWYISTLDHNVLENTKHVMRVEERCKRNEAYNEARAEVSHKISLQLTKLQATVDERNKFVATGMEDTKKSITRLTTAVNKIAREHK